MESKNPILSHLSSLRTFQRQISDHLAQESETLHTSSLHKQLRNFETFQALQLDPADEAMSTVKDPHPHQPLTMEQIAALGDELGISRLSASTDASDDEIEPLQLQLLEQMVSSSDSSAQPLGPVDLNSEVTDTSAKVNEASVELSDNQTANPTTAQSKPTFRFLKRGQGLTRFNLNNDYIDKQNRRIQANIEKAKSQPKNVKNNKQKAMSGSRKSVQKTAVRNVLSRETSDKKVCNKENIKPKPVRPPVAKDSFAEPVRFQETKLVLAASHDLQPRPARSSVATIQPSAELPTWAACLSKPAVQQGHLAGHCVELDASTESAKRERNEVKMFEFMERHVNVNASICSSSSVVNKFLEDRLVIPSPQSTPESTPVKGSRSSCSGIGYSSTPNSSCRVQLSERILQMAAQTLGPYRMTSERNSQALYTVAAQGSTNQAVASTQYIPIVEIGDQQMRLPSEPSNGLAVPSIRFLEPTQQQVPREEESSDESSESEESDDSEQSADQPGEPLVKNLETQGPGVANVLPQLPSSPAAPTHLSTITEESFQPSSTLSASDSEGLMAAYYQRLQMLQQEVLAVQRLKEQQAALVAAMAQERADLSSAPGVRELATQLTVLRTELQDRLEQQQEDRAALRRLETENKKLATQVRKLKLDNSKQLEEMQNKYKEKEAREAAALANQRSQIYQLSENNKKLAIQLKELKLDNSKQVRFALGQVSQPAPAGKSQVERPAATGKSVEKPQNATSRRVTIAGQRAPSCPSESAHQRTRSASPALARDETEESERDWPSSETDRLLEQYRKDFEMGCRSELDSTIFTDSRQQDSSYGEPVQDVPRAAIHQTDKGSSLAAVQTAVLESDLQPSAWQYKPSNFTPEPSYQPAWSSAAAAATTSSTSANNPSASGYSRNIPENCNTNPPYTIPQPLHLSLDPQPPVYRPEPAQHRDLEPMPLPRQVASLQQSNAHLPPSGFTPYVPAPQISHQSPRKYPATMFGTFQSSCSFSAGSFLQDNNISQTYNLAFHRKRQIVEESTFISVSSMQNGGLDLQPRTDISLEQVHRATELAKFPSDDLSDMSILSTRSGFQNERGPRRDLNQPLETSVSTRHPAFDLSLMPVKSQLHADGVEEFSFTSGNILKVLPDGQRQLFFVNGDVQHTLLNGVVRYFYAAQQVWRESFPDGRHVNIFNDGKKEVIHASGERDISLPDGTHTKILDDGRSITTWSNGNRLESDGTTQTLTRPDGRVQVYTPEYVRIQYPNGSVRTKYPNGIMESRYYNGVIRIKNAAGEVISDSHKPVSPAGPMHDS